MAAGSLVEDEVRSGAEFLEALDESGFNADAALWIYNSETDTWKLTIAYSGKKSDIEQKYRQAADVLSRLRENAEGDAPVLDLSKVRIVHDSDMLISGLRPVIRVEGVSSVRFSQNMINGIYVEDALIYRMAA